MKSEEGVSDPPKLKLQAVMNCLTWMLNLNLGPLEEPHMLFIAEPML